MRRIPGSGAPSLAFSPRFPSCTTAAPPSQGPSASLGRGPPAQSAIISPPFTPSAESLCHGRPPVHGVQGSECGQLAGPRSHPPQRRDEPGKMHPRWSFPLTETLAARGSCNAAPLPAVQELHSRGPVPMALRELAATPGRPRDVGTVSEIPVARACQPPAHAAPLHLVCPGWAPWTGGTPVAAAGMLLGLDCICLPCAAGCRVRSGNTVCAERTRSPPAPSGLPPSREAPFLTMGQQFTAGRQPGPAQGQFTPGENPPPVLLGPGCSRRS